MDVGAKNEGRRLTDWVYSQKYGVKYLSSGNIWGEKKTLIWVFLRYIANPQTHGCRGKKGGRRLTLGVQPEI